MYLSMSRVYFGKLLLRVEVFFVVQKECRCEFWNPFSQVSWEYKRFSKQFRVLCQNSLLPSGEIYANFIMWFLHGFGNSFNIPVPNSSTSQMQSISRYDDFFSYFWPDDDIGKVKKSSLLCVAKALESLAFVFLCCTPISLAPSWINIHCSLLNDVSSENSLYF